MSKLINAAGTEIDLDAAINLMDRDIVSDLDGNDFDSEAEWFAAYCAAHLAKFGEEFEPNKANPVW